MRHEYNRTGCLAEERAALYGYCGKRVRSPSPCVLGHILSPKWSISNSPSEIRVPPPVRIFSPVAHGSSYKENLSSLLFLGFAPYPVTLSRTLVSPLISSQTQIVQSRFLHYICSLLSLSSQCLSTQPARMTRGLPTRFATAFLLNILGPPSSTQFLAERLGTIARCR